MTTGKQENLVLCYPSVMMMIVSLFVILPKFQPFPQQCFYIHIEL